MTKDKRLFWEFIFVLVATLCFVTVTKAQDTNVKRYLKIDDLSFYIPINGNVFSKQVNDTQTCHFKMSNQFTLRVKFVDSKRRKTVKKKYLIISPPELMEYPVETPEGNIIYEKLLVFKTVEVRTAKSRIPRSR